MAKKKPVDELFHHDFDGIQEYDNDLPGWWKWLFYICILFAFGYLVHYHVIGTGDLQRAEYMKELNPDYSSTLDEASGGILSPYASPFLARDENFSPRVKAELAKLADASFEESLMRAMSKANPAQLEKLKASFPDVYKTFATGGFSSSGATAAAPEPTIEAPLKDAAALAEGKKVFETQCFTCHGKLGEGGIGPNMTDEYWIHGGEIGNLITTIRKGVPEKDMISWKTTLKPEQIDAVASYILMKLQGTNPPNAKAPQGEKKSAQAPVAPAAAPAAK